jgi:hypothetical protein
MKKEFRIFEENNANFFNQYGIAGYLNQDDANKYAKLKCEWWGSNLVYLGAELIDGYYFPQFNVFD